MKWLRRALLENWWLKLLSLGLAFALWLAVASAPLEEVVLVVPLKLRNVPVELRLAREVTSHVQLTVRSSESLLRELSYEDLGVVVDLEGFAAGTHVVSLSPENVEVPPGVDVMRLRPGEVRLELVPR